MVLSGCSLLLCAQTDGSVTGNFKQALEAADSVALQGVLSSADDVNREEMEKQILEVARAKVLAGDLDTASSLTESVLLTNFLNQDAQDLFVSIDREKESIKNLEERRKIEEAEKERQRILIETEQRVAQEKERKRLEDEQFLNSVKTIGVHNLTFRLSLSPLSFLIYKSEPAGEFGFSDDIHAGYRLPITGETLFTHPYVWASLKVSAGLTLAPFDTAQSLTDMSARVSLGTPLIRFPLRLTAGITRLSYQAGDSEATVLFTELTSPTIGLALEDVRITDRIELSTAVLWLASSAKEELIDAAFCADLTVRIKLYDTKSLVLFVAPALSGTLIMTSNGNEWAALPAIYAGVIYNDYK